MLLYGANTAGGVNKAIHMGEFKIRTVDHALAVMSVVHSAKVKWNKNTSFVSAVSMVLAHGKAKAAVLAQKVKNHPALLVQQPTSGGYIAMLENVYNYHSTTKLPIAINVENSLLAAKRATMEATTKNRAN